MGSPCCPKIMGFRRLLTRTNATKKADRAVGWNASTRERFDYESVTWSYQHPREFACALPIFRWWTTRNKTPLFPLVAMIRNNGHDDGEKRVLAPSFPLRREVGDQCSDPATRCLQTPRVWVNSRSTHPPSSVVSGSSQRVCSSLRFRRSTRRRSRERETFVREDVR